ncbi:hypothetical protein [Brevundimonas sp.]|jgi:hypothetical protein|uniref:hypothetical protein n=1 Tax=Brevundimonas sp. TaxID=1871086 RepID=UPI0037BF63CA
MNGSWTKRTLWGVNLALWVGVAYVGLCAAAMELGEAMHDSYCRDHAGHVAMTAVRLPNQLSS